MSGSHSSLYRIKKLKKLLYECVLESTLIIFVTITYYHNNSAYINIKDGDVQNCTDFDFEITKVVISSCEALFYKSNLKGRVHPTMKIMSLITESPTCRSKSVRPLFVLGTLIHIYFFFNPRAFWPCMGSKVTTTVKVQEVSKDIVR